MKIVNVNSLKELTGIIINYNRSFLLLYKSGSEQSECALRNLQFVQETNGQTHVLVADVTDVRDIHENYGITSVPALIEFNGDKPAQIVKGCHEPSFFKSLFEKNLYSANEKGAEKPAKRIVVYTTPTCPHCTTLKNYLKEQKIPFRDINVAQDQKMAEAMVKKSGQQGVPQIEINGRIVVGFNKPKIDELLEIK
ncbi:MAG TPA: glutaredoxin domain-containing protein [Bacteroidales bacterium]|nr:glutaredoxin domain-containing protein [Bacteroidales bacterium]